MSSSEHWRGILNTIYELSTWKRLIWRVNESARGSRERWCRRNNTVWLKVRVGVFLGNLWAPVVATWIPISGLCNVVYVWTVCFSVTDLACTLLVAAPLTLWLRVTLSKYTTPCAQLSGKLHFWGLILVLNHYRAPGQSKMLINLKPEWVKMMFWLS